MTCGGAAAFPNSRWILALILLVFSEKEIMTICRMFLMITRSKPRLIFFVERIDDGGLSQK